MCNAGGSREPNWLSSLKKHPNFRKLYDENHKNFDKRVIGPTPRAKKPNEKTLMMIADELQIVHSGMNKSSMVSGNNKKHNKSDNCLRLKSDLISHDTNLPTTPPHDSNTTACAYIATRDILETADKELWKKYHDDDELVPTMTPAKDVLQRATNQSDNRDRARKRAKVSFRGDGHPDSA